MASDGFEVEPADLRAAAGQVRAVNTQLHTAHYAITGQIGAAVAMNVGYETSAALRHFARSVRELARRAQDRVDEHAEALEQCADNYERAEEHARKAFTQYLTA